jgi:hypothetical protein
MSEKSMIPMRCVQYAVRISLEATSSRVWRAITDEVNEWWLPSFHVLGAGSQLQLEPHAGGRLFESFENRELLWYSVLAIEPENALTLVGHLSPEYGGPATTILTLKLIEEEETTLLVASDSVYGQISDGMVESLQSGWLDLFTNGLKVHVEA